MDYEWFQSLDGIPGVDWEPLVPIDRSKLHGLDAQPHVETRQAFDGRSYNRVEWLTQTGRPVSDESGSPASLHYRRNADADPQFVPPEIAILISESLALPGTRSDYHSLMMWAWGALYAVRRQEPRVFGWIEALCLADISLMEQGPELVFDQDRWSTDEEDGRYYPIVPAFHQLSSLYQREGFLAAAVQIEQRCAALGVNRPIGEEAIARQAALLQDDGR